MRKNQALQQSYQELVTLSEKHFRDKLLRLLEPLQQSFGITVFFYSNLKEGGRSLHLCSNPKLLEDYLYSGFLLSCPLHSRYYYTLTPAVSVLGLRSDDRPELEPIYQYYQRHQLASGITLTLYRDHYREMFYFGMDQLPAQGQSYWYSILPSLYEFIQFFHVQMKWLLHEFDSSSLLLPDIIGEEFFAKPTKPDVYLAEVDNQLGFKQRLLEFTLFDQGLTKRELSILPGCIAGKTAKQIAQELSLSPRTVENNLQQLKDKFNCRTQRELTALLHHNAIGNLIRI